MSEISPSTMQMMYSGMGAVSGLASGLAQKNQGESEAAAYQYNADVVLEEAAQKEQTTALQYQALMGRQKTLYAAAGVDIASGSPLLTAIDTAMKGSEEVSSIKDSALRQADILKYYGSMAEYRGNVGGATTFLTSLTRAGMGMSLAQKGYPTQPTQTWSTAYPG